MRRTAILLTAVVLAACAKKDETLMGAPTNAPPTAPVAPTAPAPIDLSKVAGTWAMKTTAVGSDSVLTTSIMIATADTAGWTLTLPNRKPVALKVMVMGDSVMIVSPEYESVLRKGMKVFTSGSYHMVGDSMIGNVTAHYKTKDADSVKALRSAGMKAPK
jgi:hypothetical protein